MLKGEHEADEPWPGTIRQDPADAGANLSESERSEAILAAGQAQRAEVLDALHRIELGSYGTCVDCGTRRSRGAPGGQAGGRPLRGLPGQMGPIAALSRPRAPGLE